MVDYVSSLSSTLYRFIATTPVRISTEEWVMIFFGMLVFGFVCLRGFSLRT